MSELEPRYACPVCLGATMVKLQFASASGLQLDHCQRCGGIWFDAGEVSQLRGCRPQALWRQVVLRDDAYHMTCHACTGRMPRNADACPVCDWPNILDCPVCSKPLRPLAYQGLKLDVCAACKGVWFDQIELAELWNLQLASLASSPHASDSTHTAGDTAGMFVDVMIFSSGLVDTGVEAAIHGGEAVVHITAEVISNAPNVAGAAAEGAGEVASTFFETIAEIIGGIFS